MALGQTLFSVFDRSSSRCWIGLDWIGYIGGLVDRGLGAADEVANTVEIT